ncbi:PTS sugar transporter subunit IIA [Pectinatus frisingensis]|uniref:PTS sugar transporter subunit IIA n=1 Tax=Pectinatus frisingensis TaxID=865 RepID=UPI003D8019A1
MKEKALLVITHGRFGIELVKSVEMIMGEQNNVVSMGLCLEDDVDELRINIKNEIEKFQKEGKEILLFVDVLGGSPSNIALQMVNEYKVYMITGVNMLMLISFFSNCDSLEMEELVKNIVKTGSEGIKIFQIGNFLGGK